MAFKIAIAILAISSIASGVHSEIVVTQNHEEVTQNIGEQVNLICSSNVEALACAFRSPSGTTFNMLKGATYEQGRITHLENTPNDCGMSITNLEASDNGSWECSVTGKSLSGDFEVGSGNVEVIVALAPADIHLETEGQRVSTPIQMNLDEQKQLFIDCVASGARPAPEFSWYIADTKLNANFEVREEAGEDGSMTYISTLEYNAAPKHSGQMLKCQVDHMGYSMQDLSDQNNVAQAELELQFKPDEKEKPETFYGMKEGEENNVRIKFRANPKPNAGKWSFGDVSVPVGAASTDNTFQSSQITDGDFDGEYQVDLTFTMEPKYAGKTYSLDVTNELGTTTYQFNLALSEKPPAESANGPVIGIIILVVIIILVGGIVVIARAKGALCFAAKSGEPLEEEKEAFDDAEKGKLAPSGGEPVKATPDKKPETETKAETEENKEEKKSNGAHTPV